jgi:hypothetical protein
MAGQSSKSKTSHKRSPEETRGRQTRGAELGKKAAAWQDRCREANYHAAKLRDSEIEDIRARRARNEEYRTIGKAYGLDEFTAARVVRYGRLSPWRHAEAARGERRRPLQKAYADEHRKEQMPAS